MLKKLLHTLLVLVMILSMSSQAMAAEINEPADLNIYEYIQSKEVGQIIADTITLSADCQPKRPPVPYSAATL